MSLGTTYSPTVPVGGTASSGKRSTLSVENVPWDVFRGIFWFRGGGGLEKFKGGYVEGSFHGGVCHGGSEFQ